MLFYVTDALEPSIFCSLAVVRPSSQEVAVLTEAIEAGGSGVVTSRPLPPRFFFVRSAEASPDGRAVLLNGRGSSEDFAIQDWSVLDRATGLVSGIEPEGIGALLPSYNGALQLAAWSPEGDGSIFGLLGPGGFGSGLIPTGPELAVAKRDAAGNWQGPIFTTNVEQLGFQLAPPDEETSPARLQIHQFIPLGADRFLVRISPAATASADIGKDGVVFVIGPGSEILRVVDADAPV